MVRGPSEGLTPPEAMSSGIKDSEARLEVAVEGSGEVSSGGGDGGRFWERSGRFR
ncbi:hypothetical protein HPP92_004452 [Vanilla planifolia]|uniref:Uncharacterized protein n=1 Tax=Vanilla planifolia TaxID=51239 RepID=A0A835RWT1_VANPL|nr:hypothetical protein HPP92_004452 [Vanilla planifolia]